MATSTKSKTEKKVLIEADPLAVLKAAAKPAEKKSKKSNPVIALPKELEANLTALKAAKEAKERAETEIKVQEEPIINHCRNIQDKDGCAKNFSGSYDLTAASGEYTFVTTNKWSEVKDSAAVEEIKKLTGENAGRVLTDVMSVEVKAEVLENKVMLQELLTKLGDFQKYLNVTSKTVAGKDLSSNIYDICGYNLDKVLQVRELIKQNKPYIK